MEFSNAVKKALADGELYHVNNIRRHAQNNWQASAWMLERKFPKKYGRQDREMVPEDEIPDESPVFDPSLLTVPELKQLTELGAEVQELHDKGLPADAIEAEFTDLHDKGTRNGKGEAG